MSLTACGMAARSLIFVGLCGFALDTVTAAESRRDRFIHVFVAQVTDSRFIDAARLDTDLQDSHLLAVGYGRRIRGLGMHAQTEWEAQAARHWGMQDHSEVNAFIAARWLRFPWERYVRTSAAFGTGLSHAFAVPPIENDDTDARTLIYLMLEITAAPPGSRQWSAFARIHHRSGLFGRLVDAGSNFVGLGLRRHFE